eukprot:566236-Pleurochrysis_carterae.AAC.1
MLSSDMSDDSSVVFGTQSTGGRALSELGEIAPPTAPPLPSPGLSSIGHIVHVSGGQICPDGYMSPTIDWCEIHAREEGVEFM